MASSRKRRPQSFDIDPPAGSDPEDSGWTYRTDPPAAATTAQAPASPPVAVRRSNLLDWATWPVKFTLVLLFAPLLGTRRKPE